MPPLLAVRVHGNPVRVRIEGVLIGGMRIGARDHHHVQFSAARDQVGKNVAWPEPLAAVVQRKLRRIKSDARRRR